MPTATTQRELADRIGVTPVLVSRALSGHPSVAARTRERIQAAAAEFGYRADSNMEARMLIARRHGKRVHTDIIAVLMPVRSFEGVTLPRLPFFAPFIEGVEEGAAELDMDVHLCTMRNGRLPHLLERRGVDGVISLGLGFEALEPLQLPAVCFGGPGKWGMGVLPDNLEGARLATRHLIELGHRRIACLAYDAGVPGYWYQTAADRAAGYRDALAESGIAVDETLIAGPVHSTAIEAGVEAMARLLERTTDFTALVCFNDLLAMGAIQVLRAAGRRVPDDVSVVGFDDVSGHYPFEPKLTSIAFDRYAMGLHAVAMLRQARDAADAGAPPPTSDEIFPVELVVRQSTLPAFTERKP